MRPRFVIAQVGRTGSGYTAAVLTAAGIECGHEAWWNPNGTRQDGFVGDSSWCAVPFLDGFYGVIFHQVREPLATLRSLVDEGIGTDWDTPYTRLRHLIIGGPSGDPMFDVMRVWVIMNEICERHTPMRWRVEEFGAHQISCVARCVDIPVTAEAVASAMDVPTDINKHHIPNEFGWDDLPQGEWLDQVLEMSARYGYDV